MVLAFMKIKNKHSDIESILGRENYHEKNERVCLLKCRKTAGKLVNNKEFLLQIKKFICLMN